MTNKLRTASAYLHHLALTYERNAIAAIEAGHDHEADAWNDAILRIMDVSDAMERAADRVDATDPRQPVFVQFLEMV